MILDPPPQYVHAFAGIVVERRMTAEEVENICGRGAQACSWAPIAPGGQCAIWIPIVGRGGVSKRTQDALRRHELAHCFKRDWHK